MTERWIFGFRRWGTRELADDERSELSRIHQKARIRRVVRGVISIVICVAALSGIAFASSGWWWGWLLLVIGTVIFVWVLSAASDAERLALLVGRALRVGQVDQYERIGASEAVRERYARVDEAGDTVLGSPFWEAEERFERMLSGAAGKNPDFIETPAGDNVLLMVNGRLIQRVVNVPSITVDIR